MVLGLVFIVSIPTITPYLRGDGNGYYAWLRSSVMDQDLKFANEYSHGDPVFRRFFFDDSGHIRPGRRTPNGYVNNHWGVGVAALWAPFFLVGHAGAEAGRLVGLHWRTDGYSIPYRWATAFGTALYGFLALLIAYHLARRRLTQAAPLFGTLVVWGASSLFVYQYLLPFWPFAAAAFVGAALLWAWDGPRPFSAWRWVGMGALAGLCGAIHPSAAAWGVLPVISAFGEPGGTRSKLRALVLVGIGVPIGAAPQLAGKAIVYGSPFRSGYDMKFMWAHPQLVRNLFGAAHGVFSWTPITLVAIAGIAWVLWGRDRRLAVGLLSVFAAMVVIISFFQSYEQSSYGNRFLVSFTPGFVIGAASVYDALRGRWRSVAVPVAVLFVVWNVMFAFQWAWGLTSKQGAVHWETVVSNQFTRAPREFAKAARLFVTNRGALIHHVQQVDLERHRAGQP